MSSYNNPSAGHGELMRILLSERPRFDSDEEFNRYAIAEVRKFIADLRSINIELTIRPIFGGQPATHHRATQKLGATQKLAG